MNYLFVSTCVLLLTTISTVYSQDTFQTCLEKDSISCIQLTVFRQAKSFFDTQKIDLFGGLSLIKPEENENSRQGKSIDDNTIIAIESARSVEARNSEMETYLWNSVKNFFQERSLNFNFANAARSIANAIPDEVKSDIKELVAEGRGKLIKKKIMKKLMPLFMAFGAKAALLLVGKLFFVLFIAKKALVISIFALAMAVFAGLASKAGALAGAAGSVGGGGGGGGGLFSGLSGLLGGGAKSGSSGVGVISGGNGWSSGSGGWSSGGPSESGWDQHGAYSSPVAQSLAYSGYKQASRR